EAVEQQACDQDWRRIEVRRFLGDCPPVEGTQRRPGAAGSDRDAERFGEAEEEAVQNRNREEGGEGEIERPMEDARLARGAAGRNRALTGRRRIRRRFHRFSSLVVIDYTTPSRNDTRELGTSVPAKRTPDEKRPHRRSLEPDLGRQRPWS